MRKFTVALGGAVAHVVVTAGIALAEGGSTLPTPGGDQVKGEVVRPPEPTAFTGADIGTLLVALAALLVIGGVLIVAGRRRVRATA